MNKHFVRVETGYKGPDMIIAGLTGSIAMGKSTVASMFAALGCPVFDADAAVTEFYESENASVVEAAFPGTVVNGVVNRGLLASLALIDRSSIARLEAIVHPAVAARRNRFLHSARHQGRYVALLDIPLLFETGGDHAVDLIIVASATVENQRTRALTRRNLTASKLESILSRQIPDGDKRKRAHFVIDTNRSLAESEAQVAGLVRAIAGLSGNGTLNA
jgi:dephospho-CoA kinase